MDCVLSEYCYAERNKLSPFSIVTKGLWSFYVFTMQGVTQPSFVANAASPSTVSGQEVATTGLPSDQVRVRFAPSPTGYLHVGGARTALFNWLYAKNKGGKMVLRIEDTDAARSTRESEQAVLQDLEWLGITWDEGPDVGGPFGPYRQSERKEIYREYVDRLVHAGLAYPCFCTDEELEAMKREAEEKKLPPIYRGKWATASPEEVTAELEKKTPHCFRFRVPPGETVTIHDVVRGEVSWSTDTLGDFVILRSNGLPVYNFCVAVDDAMMRITHVLRAEEHLPNTLRQVLIYKALGFPTPTFGHVSLILAPDKSKLSKRHGATSVGEFREQGYLAPAMMNFLSLLGWNDGTEQEIFAVQDLQERFSLDRITKSAAVFDKTKLGWMNGQHIRNLPEAELESMLGELWVAAGILNNVSSPFVSAAVKIVRNSLELLSDGEKELRGLLSYPLEETLASEPAQSVVSDNFEELATAVLESFDSGELQQAIAAGHDGYKKWINGIGKSQGRKGKRLFMPARIALTGRMQGPDVGEVLSLLSLDNGDIAAATGTTEDKSIEYVALSQRMQMLRNWLSTRKE